MDKPNETLLKALFSLYGLTAQPVVVAMVAYETFGLNVCLGAPEVLKIVLPPNSS